MNIHNKLIIIGSGPAGLTASIYAARGGIEPLVISGNEPGEELIIPKSYTPLSTISSFTGSLNGMEIPRNTILIDDYSDQHNRIVHIVIPNFKLEEFTNQIIKEGGNSYAIFELKPILK